ncbi:MAG: Signal peptidase I [Parcubacteria bacterium C7867-007]|nr:MAG: Signal peptidase I [Parcubacteria bacterium C7867-007]
MNDSSLIASAAGSIEGLDPSILAAMLFAIGILIVVCLAIGVLLVVANWFIFRKAGKPGWASLIPFYNNVVMLQFTNLPLWWIVLMFIPIVNIVIGFIMLRRLAGVFGKGILFTIGLILLPFIFWPILGFGRSVYANTYAPAGPMSEAVKWSLIGLFACLLIQTAFIVRVDSFVTAIEEADPAAFETTDGSDAIDNNNPYYEGEATTEEEVANPKK